MLQKTHDPLPLTNAAMYILLALVDRDRHGLGIAEHIEEFTTGSVSLGPGSLYGTIKRLLEQGFIEDVAEAPKDERGDPRRRYYRVTANGRRALERHTYELSHVLRVATIKKVIR